jgi:hypothetical protein
VPTTPTPTIKRVCINKTNHSKTLHLVVEINQALFEGLVDISASIFVMVVSVVRELGIMHMVSGHETYKTLQAWKNQGHSCYGGQGRLLNEFFCGGH